LIGFSFLILFEGCSKTPDAPVVVQIDQTLPIVMINGTLQDRNAIAFEWKAITDPKVQGFYVYRNDPISSSKKLHRIDAVKKPQSTHYVDNAVAPGTTYQYRFSTYNKRGSESKASKTITVTTLPKLQSVSFFASINSMPRSAKLIWRPHTNNNVKSYILERKTDEKDAKYKKIATIEGRLNAEYIDLKLKDDTTYYYRLFALTYDKFISEPAKPVKVSTKKLPKKVQEISVTQDQPKQITLTWQANTETDLAFYNIYRSESATDDFDYYVKLHETKFIDKINEDEKEYFYKLSAVDVDGLESPLSNAVKGTSLKRPATPIITSAIIADKSARLHWKSTDKRVQSYIIIKTTKTSWISKTMQEIKNITQTQFTDVNIIADQQYIYEVIAVDKNGIRSLPSEEQKLMFEKVKP